MAKRKQLTVSCENRPGTLAHVARVLGDAKVSIIACNVATSGAEGFVHLVADNVNKGKKALAGAGLSYTEGEVHLLELPNVPGALANFAGKLAAKDINITGGYATAVKGSKKTGIVLAVSDLDKASRIR